MVNTRWKEMFELLGLAAIVASLIFVGYQLRQDRTIARSELTSETIALMNEINLRASEPDMAKTITKMMSQPEDLTLADVYQLDRLFSSVVGTIIRECALKARGVFDECDNLARTQIKNYFSSNYGRAWFRLNAPRPDSVIDLPSWLHDEMNNPPPETHRQRLMEVKESM